MLRFLPTSRRSKRNKLRTTTGTYSRSSSSGNATDIAKWQAEASVKGGGFIATFADHRGSFRNDSTDEIKQHVLNMSQKDWQDFKDHPERKDDLARMLKSLGKSKDDVESVMGVLQAKMTAKGDTDGPHKLVDSISTMSKEDQEKYRTNEDFRKQTDAEVKATLARVLLSISRNECWKESKQAEDPAMDIADKIMTNAIFSHDDKQAKADIEKAVKDDPDVAPALEQPTNWCRQRPARATIEGDCWRWTNRQPIKPIRIGLRPKDAGKKSLLDTLRDDKGGFWSATDVKGSLTAVQNMTPDEQKQYRDNSGTPPYRRSSR